MMWGGELVLRDGQPAGQVTSVAWSATLGARGLAYVWRPDRGPVLGPDLAQGVWEVTVGDAVKPVEVQASALLRSDLGPCPELNRRWRTRRR